MSNPRANCAIATLLEHPNAAKFTYSGIKLGLANGVADPAKTLELVPDRNPTDRKV